MGNQTQIVGTIIASILSYDQLNETINEKKGCDFDSTYAPCDGRVIDVKSELGKILKASNGSLNVPDLRGKFIRGLNIMDPLNQPQQAFDSLRYGDPDGNRKSGDYQPDAIIEHDHGFAIGNFQNNADDGTTRSYVGADYNQHLKTSGAGIAQKNQYETRPRNVAVYFYIKIN